MKCFLSECNLEQILCPVPGARSFPRRLECPKHGYGAERHSNFTTETFDPQDMAEMLDGFSDDFEFIGG